MDDPNQKRPENQPSKKKGGWFLWNNVPRNPSKGARIFLNVMIVLLIGGLIAIFVLGALGVLSK